MNKIYDLIFDELYKKNVNWTAITELVRSMGAEINNVVDEENTILSELLGAVEYKRGDRAVKLTEIFLQNGFDVKANEGFNGLSCLRALCWAFYDYRILHVAEMLIDAGTDCNKRIDFGDGEKELVIDSIEWKSGDWMTGSFDSGNLFEAYHLMVKRAMEGKPYKGIRTFDDAKGLTVTRVEKIISSDEFCDEQNVGEGLILWCGDVPVVANDCVEFMINPYVCEDTTTKDVTGEYKDIVGLIIKSLFFKSQTCARLYFKENKYLLFDNSYLHGSDSVNKSTRCIIKNTASSYRWNIGDRLVAIKFDSGFSCAPHCVELAHWGMYFESEEGLFHVTGVNEHKDNGELCIDEIPMAWGCGLTRCLDVNSIVVEEAAYVDKTLKWICFKANEGFVYVLPDSFFGVKCFITYEKLDSPYIYPRYDNARCKQIKLWDRRNFRNLRFLTSSHSCWNCIEIWLEGDKVRYKLEWHENLNENIPDLPGPYITTPTVGYSKSSRAQFLRRLDKMHFDAWFREDNIRASKYNEVVWWMFYDDGTGIQKWRDHLDQPQITQEQMDDFIALMELVVE